MNGTGKADPDAARLEGGIEYTGIIGHLVDAATTAGWRGC